MLYQHNRRKTAGNQVLKRFLKYSDKGMGRTNRCIQTNLDMSSHAVKHLTSGSWQEKDETEVEDDGDFQSRAHGSLARQSWQSDEDRQQELAATPSKRITLRLPWKLEKAKVTGVKEFVEQFTEIRSKYDEPSESWPLWRRWAKMIVASPGFEWFCASLILLCALLIGTEANWNIQNIGINPPEIFRILNATFNFLFALELVLRVLVDGLSFFSFYNPSIHWNLMDAALVSVAVVEEIILVMVAASAESSLDLSGLKVLRMLRLARILRIVKVVRFFSELRIMVNGVIGSARSLCWALLLIMLVNFLFLG